MITAWLQRVRKSTFLMNALHLMLATFVVAAAGFVFWVVIARLYDATTVGLATTLLSVSGLLSLVGLAGFDTTFVRFLPKSERKNDYINTGGIIVTFISAALAVGLGLILPWLVPSLSILSNPWAFLGFVFFTVVTSLNILTNAVFLSFKQAHYIFIINTLSSIFKVIAPVMVVLVIARGDAMTVFVLAGGAQLVGLLLSIFWMKRKFGYKFSCHLHRDTLRLVRKFSSLISVSSILNLLPPTFLPLLVLSSLGAENTAYYYMAFTIASALYTVAYALMQSVFTEGSHDEEALGPHLAKATKLIALTLVPAALITALLSSFLLDLFGQEYANSASQLLQLFVLGALPVAIYSALGAIFKVTKNMRAVVLMNVAYAVVILGISIVTIPSMGLIAVGWAWLIGNLAACGIGALFVTK